MGLLRTARRAAVASAVHGSVQRRQRDRWAAADHPPTPTPPSAAQTHPKAAAPTGSDDVLAQLERLGELRNIGVLTDEEFAAQKARVLG